MKNLFKKTLACCLAVCMVFTLCISAVTVNAEAYDGELAIAVNPENVTNETTELVVTYTADATNYDRGIAAAKVDVSVPEGLTIKSVGIDAENFDENASIQFFAEGEKSVVLDTFNWATADVPVVADNVFSYIVWCYAPNATVLTAPATLIVTYEGVFEVDDVLTFTTDVEACKDDVEFINLEEKTVVITVESAACKHANVTVLEAVAATCTETGLTEGSKCADCDEVLVPQETVNALGHTEETIPAVPATCTAAGSTAGVKCSVCETVITAPEAIEALGHTPAEAVIENDKAPTCTVAGSYDTVVYCSVCEVQISRETTTVDALDHAWNEGEVTTAPECEKKGVKTYTCGTCGDTYTEDIDALGHTEETIPAVPATCTTAGSTAGVKCSVCETVITAPEAIEALGHTPAEAVIENEVAATCLAAGSYDTVVYCSVCEAEISRTTIPTEKLDHVFGDNLEFCANNCGTENPNYVPPCEHIDANQDGICDNECGYENLDASLKFLQKSMNLGADISGVFVFTASKKTSPYVDFKVIATHYKDGGPVKSELPIIADSSNKNNYIYGFGITIAPKEMADVIETRIVGITAEGEAFTSNLESWSIKQGLIELMDGFSTKTTEDAHNRLVMCANMLNYGAEAQKTFSYNLDNLATDGLSEEYAALIITETPEMSVIPKADETGATYKLYDISFNLAAKVEILPMFIVGKSDDKEIYSAEITQVHTAPDGTVTTDSYTIEGKDCLKQSSILGVYINNLASNDLRDILTVTVYKNGKVVSATHTFSAESVAKSKFNTNPTLYSAMMVYGDCARTVFG